MPTDEIKRQKVQILNHSILVRKLELKDPWALLFLAHGYAEHSGRYEHVMQFMKEKGISSYALDHIGHGESSGPRGYIQKFEDYGDVFLKFIRMHLEKKPIRPIFILGHSFGGLVVADLLKRTEQASDLGFAPSGIIFTSPFWWLKNRSFPKLALGRVLSRLRPTFNFPSAIDPFVLTHDRECSLNYASDPLIVKGVNVRWFCLAMEKQSELREKSFVQDFPLLALLAGDDRLSDSVVALEMIKKTSSQQKEWKVYDRYYHEILNESGKELVMADIFGWMQRVCPSHGKTLEPTIDSDSNTRSMEQTLS